MDEEIELPICNVCNKNQSVGIASSMFGAVSLAYCAECLEAGRDSYGLLVGSSMGMPVVPSKLTLEDFREDLRPAVLKTLEFAGKSFEDLQRDAGDSLDEMQEYYRNEETNDG